MTDAPKDWNCALANGQLPQDAADRAWATGEPAQPRLVWSRPSLAERPAEPDEEIERLALLSPLDYERVRDAEAKRLKVRISVLDEEVRRQRKPEREQSTGFLEPPVPWDHPVDGGGLLDDIASTLERYVILPKHAASAVALWIVMAHAMDCFYISPILAIESPEKRCGKTTLLSIVQHIAPKPLTAANMTSAAVFRTVEAFAPTLVLDEADTFLTADNPELVGILNSGHSRASAFVIRLVGDNHDVKQFGTWCPKVIALIGQLPSTLQDRSIAIRMVRRQNGETVERRRSDRVADLQRLCRQAARWAGDHAAVLRACDPAMPSQLNDRATDNWRPLMAIAQVAGGRWPAIARLAALELSGSAHDEQDLSKGVMLLRDCRRVFEKLERPQIGAEQLVTFLCGLDEAPWSEWRRGEKPITARGVAVLLKPFGIASKHTRVARDYCRPDFEDAWARYLPPRIPESTVTSVNSLAANADSPSKVSHGEDQVTHQNWRKEQ